MEKYVLKYKGEAISEPGSRTAIEISKMRYIAKNKIIIAHDLTVEPWLKNQDESEQRCVAYDSEAHNFESCKTKQELIEALYFWANEYKEADVGVDSWMLCAKLRKLMRIAEKFP